MFRKCLMIVFVLVTLTSCTSVETPISVQPITPTTTSEQLPTDNSTIVANNPVLGITIVGVVMDASLSARIIMLKEPVEGFRVIALAENCALRSSSGEEIELNDIQPGMKIQASGQGQMGESDALIANSVQVLETIPMTLQRNTASADDVGLVWQECHLSEAHFGLQNIEDCFNHSALLRNDDEGSIIGKSINDTDLQIVIGRDVYRTILTAEDKFPFQEYTLYKNELPVKTLAGMFGAHSPNLMLINVGGKTAWEFAIRDRDKAHTTIFFDDQDICQHYELDNAYRPYSLADKLIFIGQKGDKFIVVYDGLKIGPDFDEIVIEECCERAIYSVQFGSGNYLFYGIRGEEHYLVEIAARNEQKLMQ